MAKLKLGAIPKTFKQKVEIPLLNGETLDITFDFKYKTRSEFGAFVDKYVKSVSEAPKGKKQADDEAQTLEGHFVNENEANAKYILEIADGWDLEDEFNQENITQLIDACSSANTAIGDAYSQALTKGRIKN